ncbi:ferrochelatase [Methyloferula stellata]|uniref:ferrochelatase n=1 Tax=Methyloferula stellata TaxID=876270 RepID=UPI001FCA7F43|nr:ferrochelatase [Methyloferula stellata]
MNALSPISATTAYGGRIGVLLVNLGSPSGTDYWSMRRYLKEFLSDRRVIETPRLIWWPILNLIILSTRPARKGTDYAAIWNKARDEAPLKTMTRAQAETLETAIEIGSLGFPEEKVRVAWAMRYGEPAIEEAIHSLQKHGCDRILLVPLYPQYAAATSATVCDKAFEVLSKMRWQPTLRVAHPYFDQPAYIEALAASLRKELAKLDFTPEVILASFHGMPQAYVDKGDPYAVQCEETRRLLRDAMGYSDDQFRLTFQSRFGPAQWLKPYTDETVKALPGQGVKKLAIITPGFVADCLETIEEIGIENRDYFLSAGGQKFARIPCLNESEEGMSVIFDLVKRELSGWV